MAGYIAPDRCARQDELVVVETPFVYRGQPIRVTCHKAVKRRFLVACHRAKKYSQFGVRDRVERMDSYNCRSIRGSTTISNHGKGKAWDIFATGPTVPPPGGVWKPDDTFGKQFARCFSDLGFTWGSQWQRADWPHIEWSGNYVPKLTTKERLRTLQLARDRYKKGNN